jgi:predicted SAM-dependent methyltransferase
MNRFHDRDFYSFSKYISKNRWSSFWHQLDEVLRLEPSSVLAIGKGPGIFQLLAEHFKIHVHSLDINPDLHPDFVASVARLPFQDHSYDVVCAFQVLEHLEYEKSVKGFSEMARVARKAVVISLPDAKKSWRYVFHIPGFGEYSFFVPLPFLRDKSHMGKRGHFWEINQRGFSLKKVLRDFSDFNCVMKKTFRVKENRYHRFFVFLKNRELK